MSDELQALKEWVRDSALPAMRQLSEDADADGDQVLASVLHREHERGYALSEPSPSPEALDLRHAGHARLLNQEDDPSTPDGAYAADEPVEEE